MVQENGTYNSLEFLAFVEVVRCGGITAAADKLNISKSTVSMQVSRLEKRLGIKLLSRSSRRMSLTPEGELALPKIQSLLAEADQLFEDAANATQTPKGVVRIATTPAFGYIAITKLAPLVRKTYPDLQLVINPTYELEDIQDPAFDFAIRVGKVSDEGLVAREIGTFQRILVASPDFLQQQTLETPSQLATIDCIGFSGRTTKRNWHLIGGKTGQEKTVIPIDSVLSIHSYSTLLSLAEQGLGIISIGEFAARKSMEAGRLVRCLPDWQSPPMPVMLAYRFGATKVTRVACVIELARQVIQGILSKEIPSRSASHISPG